MMWPFQKAAEQNEPEAWIDDSIVSPLLRHDTLHFGKLPSLDMLRVQRLYGVHDEIVPKNFSRETLRTMTRILFEKCANVFVERKTAEVFITAKSIEQIENCKAIPLDGVLTSIETAPFVKAFCSFLLNEYLPALTLEASKSLPFSFLCDFDEILSVRIRSSSSFKFANFRNLAYRICTTECTKADLDCMNARLVEKYDQLIKAYQSIQST